MPTMKHINSEKALQEKPIFLKKNDSKISEISDQSVILIVQARKPSRVWAINSNFPSPFKSVNIGYFIPEVGILYKRLFVRISHAYNLPNSASATRSIFLFPSTSRIFGVNVDDAGCPSD